MSLWPKPGIWMMTGRAPFHLCFETAGRRLAHAGSLEVEHISRRIGDAYRLARKPLEPGPISGHGTCGRLQVLPACGPGLGMGGPPVHGSGMSGRARQRLQIGGIGADYMILTWVGSRGSNLTCTTAPG